ncbi:asparaginase [Pseudomonas arsenicoxydans]|uniref:Asparaginase n=1 Tax=Pseudomonas arsenicoxydans TaxID=702115 RepID=A0A502HR30_9PSED|nr:asparaginase [Pseudomonas arsenicoxydans]TPG75836.1 asparaginase [Pseudomonas arsenicoxydans]
MDFPAHVPLAVATRNQHVERIHWGSVAVVDTEGALLAYAGDPGAMMFSRSTLKPFQAVPFVRDGGVEHFGFSDDQVAVMCASHSGEASHVNAVSSMLAKIRHEVTDLGCGCHLPDFYSADNLPPAGFHFDQRHHNCSGKHTGFLAYCRLHGLASDSYLAPDHPLQRDIQRVVTSLSGVPENQFWAGTDGCNAPNLGMPLSRLALLWARLASGDAGSDASLSAVLQRLFDAMRRNPQMVSGTGRSDLGITLASNGDWVAKTGADGVQTVGIRSRGLGVAVKVSDGDFPTVFAITIAVLKQLGVLEQGSDNPLLAPWADPALNNCNGAPVGQLKATVQLKFV